MLLRTDLQSAAIDHSATSPFLEHRVRFELTTLRICNPLHWTTLPPVHVILVLLMHYLLCSTGLTAVLTVYVHSYSGMIKPMAYISKTNTTFNCTGMISNNPSLGCPRSRPTIGRFSHYEPTYPA